MIDVPIRVRDALKDGSYKKNYRFIVGYIGDEPVYDYVDDLAVGTPVTVNANGDYRIYSDTDAHFTYLLNNVSHTVTDMTEDLAGGYYIALDGLVIGNEIEITESYYSLVFKKKTSRTQEVYHPEYTIENDRLVKESVKIDERMCSTDELRFGLCEGSNLEFQAFNIENLTDKRIQAFVDVDYPVVSYDYDEDTGITTKIEEIETFSIPMGWFDVQESSRQASTGIRKISAYNKLKSEYLDADAKALIIQEFGDTTVKILDILAFLLRNYGIKTLRSEPYIPAATGGGSLISNAKKSFTYPYKYSESPRYENGAFTMLPFWQGRYPAASTKFYMEGYALMRSFGTDWWRGNDVTLQVKVDDCVEQIDTIIANYIKAQFADMANGGYIDRTAAQMWASFSNMYSKDLGDMAGYFFYVVVVEDSRVRYYGNNFPNADGTFAQLSRMTFSNVQRVSIVAPIGIRYGYKFAGSRLERMIGSGPEHIENYVPLYGEAPDAYRNPPRMPDGTAIPYDLSQFFNLEVVVGGYSPAEMVEVKTSELSQVTLRNIQTAVFEINCQFGKLDRVNNFFAGTELNNRRLYPAENLYPDDELYPLSTSESGFKAMYSKLWADEGNIRSWRNLIITYKGLIKNEETHEVEETEKIYQTVVDANGTDDYEIKDNWLFKNILWADAESEDFPEAAGLEKVEDYAAAMVDKMQSVSWFPFEMWCAGLPYVEPGDEVEINVADQAYTSYVLRRSIKGIQNLQDEMINGTLDIF